MSTQHRRPKRSGQSEPLPFKRNQAKGITELSKAMSTWLERRGLKREQKFRINGRGLA